jgi:citronellyl-CoA dehydrogenase
MGTINSGGVSTGLVAHTEICLPALSRFGSHELKQQFLAPSISGEYVACLGISEAHAGSDVANAKTTAKRVGDDLIINGGKMWITNGLKADWMCCFANTNQGKKHANKSLICVPLNEKGVSRTKIHKIGLHASDTAQIFFEDVRVPAKNIIGDEGAGFLYTMLQFQAERLGGCLAVLKSFDRAIGHTIEYTKQRQAFGKSVLDNQVVHFRLGELATEVESLRALVYRAVDMMNDGEDVTRLASMCKLKAGRLAREVSDTCLQYWGGMGYSRETLISRMFRDSRILSIYAGTDEIMLEIICKLMDISPKPPKKEK